MAADGPVGTVEEIHTALRDAVDAALHAPSILNTQPWSWHLRASILELRRDTSRQLPSIDAQGRLATLSCGAALHHASVFLSAHGHRVTIQRLPDAGSPSILARLRIAGEAEVDHRDQAMARAIRHRHTDRRPIAGGRPVDDAELALLISAATTQGASLHRVTETQRQFLAVAAHRAQSIEGRDEIYRRELSSWTVQRPRDAGVSHASLVAPVERPIALRDFADGGETGLHPGFGDDRNAEYLILSTAGDESLDWLRAGEATSAVWLTATANQLAMSAISDVVEVAGARALLGSLLAEPAHPQLVLRTGPQRQPTPPPSSSRRKLSDVLHEDPPAAG
jgi:nitroreductase